MNIELMKCKCLLIYTWENLNFKLRFSNILCIIYVVRILCHFHNFMKTQMSQAPLANVKPLLIYFFLSLFWVNDIDLFYKKIVDQEECLVQRKPKNHLHFKLTNFCSESTFTVGLIYQPNQFFQSRKSRTGKKERNLTKKIKKRTGKKERKKRKKERKKAKKFK